MIRKDDLANPNYHFFYLQKDFPQQYKTIEKDRLMEICQKRVRAHKKIEWALISFQNQTNEKYQEFVENRVRSILSEFNLLLFSDDFKIYRDEDQISHYFLRLVYAQNDDMIRKFVKNEEIILECRLRQTRKIEKDAKQFMAYLETPIQPVTNQEFQAMKEQILISSNLPEKYILSNRDQLQSEFSKVPFQYILSAVDQMKVFLSKGNGFIHESYLQIFKAVINTFGQMLTGKLIALNNNPDYQGLEQNNEKIFHLIKQLPEVDISNNDDLFSQMHSKNKHKINLQNIDLIAKQSFPPCMKFLYDKVKELHHLKHFGRLQLGLFLKGAGLQIEEALYFWKS